MKIAIIIPTYNERENIKELIHSIFSVFKANKIKGSVIVVDDNSPDGTWKVVNDLSKNFSIILIKRKRKMGLGSAYITGFKEALKHKYDIVFEMDGDLSHNPVCIPKFLEKLKTKDVVIGCRYEMGGRIVGWGKVRKIISLGGNLVGRLLAGIEIPDVTSGYRAYKRKCLEIIDLSKIKSNGYAFQLEMLVKSKKHGFSLDTVPIIFNDRQKGKSKLSKRDIVEFIKIALYTRMRKL